MGLGFSELNPDNRDESLHAGHSALRRLLIAGIITALLMGPIVLVWVTSSRPIWSWLPAVVFLTALESIATTHWLQHPGRRHVNRTTYRLAELIVIAVVLRLLTWGLTGGLPGWETWRAYLLSPLSFFDNTFSVYLLCGIFAWERGVRFAGLFLRLTLRPAEIDYYSLPRLEQARRFHDRPIDRERPQVFADLVKSWLGGGLVLALFTAMTTVDLPALNVEQGLRTVARLGLRSEILVALLVYFLGGLWLVSQARLSMMRARWLADGVDTRHGVIASWRRNSLIVLVLVALVAAFLPIGSTFGIAAILQALVGLVTLLMQLIFLFFTFLFLAFLSLLGIAAPAAEELEFVPSQPATPPPAPAPTPLGETSALVAGGFFWVLVVVITAIAVLFFLRDRGYLLEITWLERGWQGLLGWLRSLFQSASRQATSLGRTVATRLNVRQLAGKEGHSPWRFIRVNALPPREQIRFFYLSTVRRAGERGVPRQEGETPTEYARELKESWPEAEGEIEALTHAFLEARYSRRDFNREQLNPLKAIWRRVSRTLRRSRHGGKQTDA